MSGDSLQCEYLGWGQLEEFRSRPLAENEALLSTAIVDSPGSFVRSLMDCAHSPELQAKIPPQFSDNDLAEVIVEMVRTLPDKTFQEWGDRSPSEGS